ncbi:hypothetical protein SBA5_250095 [Candidatus Sulfotelmatomonas gaucii]|uniref:Uncharacterized protein n=1 Tax=Candidatus Sulfuritelmatomonas gaucii TaxID=2043161 RepID=A0A2N9LA68_9BACT|nr:hypothetical protein SBA5_250095 [Candidatus Sulfotelmatomonas gaucii]
MAHCGDTALTAVLVRVVVRMFVLMGMFVGGVERMGGHGHDQAAMLHAFEADEDVGEVLHAARLAVNDQHFKTGIVVEVRVARGNDEVVMRMLRFSEPLGDAVRVVVEDEGNGADDGCSG